MHRATNPRKSFVATGTGWGKKEMASILRNMHKRKKRKKEPPRKKPITFVFYFRTKIPSPKITDRLK